MVADLDYLSSAVQHLIREFQSLYKEANLQGTPCVVGYSGGKDSTATLQLVWYALLGLQRAHATGAFTFNAPVYVVTTDTLVENPVVATWVARSHSKINEASTKQGLPIQAVMLRPKITETFWVKLIGIGYAAPNRHFRWCTERMKIRPTGTFIEGLAVKYQRVFMALGVRKKESANRRKTMEKLATRQLAERLSPHASLTKVLVYSPIEEWTTEEVWAYLLQVPNPWGHSNRDLMTLYRNASDDTECPLVVDSTTPSCGGSRFGCWTCTVVGKDKSMTAMIENSDGDMDWMRPLIALRDELDVEDNTRREIFRSNGEVRVYKRKKGDLAAAPSFYRKEWREYWLLRLLTVEEEVRRNGPDPTLTLITLEELQEIRRIWLIDKNEWEDTLPVIYAKAKGVPYPDPENPFSFDSFGLSPQEWRSIHTRLGERTKKAVKLYLLRQERNTFRDFFEAMMDRLYSARGPEQEVEIFRKVEYFLSRPKTYGKGSLFDYLMERLLQKSLASHRLFNQMPLVSLWEIYELERNRMEKQIQHLEESLTLNESEAMALAITTFKAKESTQGVSEQMNLFV